MSYACRTQSSTNVLFQTFCPPNATWFLKVWFLNLPIIALFFSFNNISVPRDCRTTIPVEKKVGTLGSEPDIAYDAFLGFDSSIFFSVSHETKKTTIPVKRS